MCNYIDTVRKIPLTDINQTNSFIMKSKQSLFHGLSGYLMFSPQKNAGNQEEPVTNTGGGFHV